MNAVHNNRFRRHALAAGMAAALGLGGIGMAQADIYVFRFGNPGTELNIDGVTKAITPNDGLFTMLSAAGAPLTNNSYPYYGDPTWYYGLRSQIQGTLTYDTATGTGEMTIEPFEFFDGATPADAQGITISAIGNGDGNPASGSLWLGNMLFNWNNNSGIPVSVVWDAAGVMQYIGAGGARNIGTDTISATGAVPATDDIKKGNLPIGPAPVATTTWNTTTVNCIPGGGTTGDCMDVAVSGGLPLTDDSIGGSPMVAGPFEGFNANFDLVTLTLTNFTDTTAPVITLGGGGEEFNLSQGDLWSDPVSCEDAIDGPLTEGAGLTIGGDAVDTGTPGTYIITYQCEDSSANTANANRTIEVVATGTPVITLTGDNPLSFEAAASYTDPGAACLDDEDGTISLGAGLSITSNTVQSKVPGSYSVTYTCSDTDTNSSTATRTVNVVDTTPPAITLTPTCPIVVMGGPGEPDPTPSASATDIVDGIVVVNQTGDTVNPNPTFTAGQLSRLYNLGFSATDTAGNTTTVGCQITVGNPTPVVTLNGAANVTLNEGDGYDDPGASCQDFNLASPGTPDVLTATADIGIDTTTPAGSYTITYSCTDDDMNTGTAIRTVVIAGGDGYTAAPTSSGSVFTMLNPNGSFVGGATDIFANWDGSFLTSTADNTINMTMGSALPEPFFGFPWQSHSIRVFGPGSYSLTTSRGNPLSFTVGPNQIGAHMLFDWNNNNNIDVAIVWDINGVFPGPGNGAGQIFNLVSVDGDGDGIPGIRMPDGPFTGFSANFNINFTPAYTLSAAEAPVLTVDQGGTTRTVLIGGGDVTVTASTGSSFDWSGSSAALVSRAVGGTDGATFTFDPSTLAVGIYTVAVAIDDGAAAGSLLINVVSSTGGLDVADDDNDGIPNHLDEDASGATPTAIQIAPGGASVMASGGKLELGETAFTQGADGVGVTMQDIVSGGGIADEGMEQSCIGGCFDFVVTDLMPGSTVQVVLPLAEFIPEGAVYRKLIGGNWRDFSATSGNSVESAPSVGGTCPSPASADYAEGLTAGDDCVRLTLTDGGPNDADGLPNGIVRDPGGVAVATVVETPVSTIGDPSTGGGCAIGGERQAHQRLDLWLLTGLLGWLGLRRKQAS